MKFYTLTNEEYDLILLPGIPIRKNLGPLPKGIYNYNLYFRNLYPQDTTVTLEIAEGNDRINKQVLQLYSTHNYFDLSFEPVGRSKEDCVVTLSLTQGKEILAVLPVSPTLPENRVPAAQLATDLIDQVKQDLAAFTQRDSEPAHKQPQGIIPQTPPPASVPANLLQANLQHLLTFEQAERQLDYVIQHKLFALENTRGFQKWKRSVYRGVVQFLYRKLLAGKGRKTYIVKLYRNYQNNNILSELQS